MSNERLTWQQIKEKYPHQNVGLVDIEYLPDSAVIKSAIVKYTDKNSDINEMSLLALQGKINVIYTTFDEDDAFGGLTCERI